MASFSTRTHAHDGNEYTLRVKRGEKTGQELFQVVPDVDGVHLQHWHPTEGKAIDIYKQVLKARTS